MRKAIKQVRSILRPKKIGVCTAWGSPFVWTDPAYNMMNLEHPKGVEIRFFRSSGRDPGRRHMHGVEQAMEWGATHIAFLGPDQIHAEDILVKFTDHMAAGWAAVTGLVPVRGWVPGLSKPFQKIAWKWKEGIDRSQAKLSTEYLEAVSKFGPDYEEIAVVGSGALMFDVSCLEAMRQPWFLEAPASADGRRPSIMDTMFCFRLVTEGGAALLLDRTINIWHVDAFPIDDSYGDRFYDYPKKGQLTQDFGGYLQLSGSHSE